MAHQRIAAAIVLWVLLAGQVSYAKLLMVYSIQRHGARNVLPKTSLLKEGSIIGGPTLLPQGQRQTYDAGVAFHTRYISNATCAPTSTCLTTSALNATNNATAAAADNYGVLGQPGVGYGNFDVFVRSSSLDRTIMSGYCFFNGIFPADNPANATHYLPTGNQVVPIYTQSDPDDVLIRAYTKCPAYQANLEAFYASPEFANKSADSAALRAQVAAAMPGTDTSLQNWWNVYDAINVWTKYGVGDPTPRFPDIFPQIQALAYWLETVKMRSSLTGSLLSGYQLADLLSALQSGAAAAVNATALASNSYYKLLSLSAHYNTQLALLAALGLDEYAPARQAIPWFQRIPALAAVMVVELHQGSSSGSDGSSELYVRVVVQDGPAANYTAVPLPCATDAAAQGSGLGPGVCTLAAFEEYARPRAYGSVDAWCGACGNTDVAACRASLNVRLAVEGKHDEEWSAWRIAVAAVATFAGCMMAVLCVTLWCRYRQQRRAKGHGWDGGSANGGVGAAGLSARPAGHSYDAPAAATAVHVQMSGSI